MTAPLRETRPEERTEHKPLLCLEFHCEGEQISARCHEGNMAEHGTLIQAEAAPATLSEVLHDAAVIMELLGHAERDGLLSQGMFETLRGKCLILYDSLIPPRIKKILDATPNATLLLGMDDRLVSIPWEIMFDGEEFLSIRFAMGRVVWTRQDFASQRKKTAPPLDMLLLADPQDNLDGSYQEGIMLRDMMDEHADKVRASLKTSAVTKDFAKENLRFYDLFHYAGHADYQIEDPGQSGLMLADGKLTAQNILAMAGRQAFPSFIFANACHSGHTDAWHKPAGLDGIHGLANAFLRAGVRHYLGAFREIRDEPSHIFALAVYENLVGGAPMGEAVRGARETLRESLEAENITWAGYMLYGDPAFSYFPDPGQERESRKKTPEAAAARKSSQAAVVKLRGSGGAFPFLQESRRSFLLTLGGFIVLAFMMAFFFSSYQKNVDTASIQQVQAHRSFQNVSPEESDRIDKLIGELADRYRQNQDFSATIHEDSAKAPLSLVFIDMAGKNGGEDAVDPVIGLTTKILQDSRRIQVVERFLLQRLLEELKLSSSNLTDPGTALRLGRILSARLMVTGSLYKEESGYAVNARLIDTETTAVDGALSFRTRSADIEEAAAGLGRHILESVRSRHPLEGKIIADAAGKGLVIDIGGNQGAGKGMVFDVLTGAGEPVARIKTTVVGEGKAEFIVLNGTETDLEGMTVRESRGDGA